jgi:hypothetical protein
MKAKDVLRDYAAGQRNFHKNPGLDLHGQSFFKQDLSDADFTGANIKQTNFTGANLKGANFTRARAGIQNQDNSICFGSITSVVQAMLIFAILFFTGIAEISSLPKQANYLIIALIISLIAASCIIIARLGFTAKSFLILAVAIVTAFMIVVSGFSGKVSYTTGAVVIIGGVL